MLILWMVLSVARGTECTTAISSAEVEATLDRAEAAWRAVDDTTFRDQAAALVGVLLPCTREPLSPAVAFRTHVVMALHLWLIGDEDRARAAMDAARLADPDAELDPTLVAPDHPLREAPPERIHTRKVPEPREGSVSFDGHHLRDRPVGVPTLLQVIDGTGRATTTAWLDPREPMPRYPAVPRRRNTLIGCSGAALVLAGATYAGTWGLRADLMATKRDMAASPDALDAKWHRLNALSLTVPPAFLGIAAGCGVGAAMVGER